MRPLDGLVVIDLARRYPGAFTAMILGDFGARVIKVDPPGAIFPLPDIDSTTDRFAAYYALDRNKESITLNLKTPAGKAAYLRLTGRADIVVDGFRPGVMARAGLGYEKLRDTNAGLIYCSLTGYGQTGPYKDLPSHDMNYIALCGLLSMVGPKGGRPCFPGNYTADMAGAGLNGVIGILLALTVRASTGKGQFIDIAYADGAMGLLTMDASCALYSGKVPLRGETFMTGDFPGIQALQCKNGEYFTIACLEPVFWQNLCKAIGREDLAPHHYPADPDKRQWAIGELQKVFLTRTRDEWWDLLRDKETCVAPVNNFFEAFDNPQFKAREMIVEMDHPTHGKVRQIGIPVKLSDTPGRIEKLGVQPGTDTEKVLAWLGYSEAEIKDIGK